MREVYSIQKVVTALDKISIPLGEVLSYLSIKLGIDLNINSSTNAAGANGCACAGAGNNLLIQPSP